MIISNNFKENYEIMTKRKEKEQREKISEENIEKIMERIERKEREN